MKNVYKSLFAFGLLMWAINPAVEHINWLFYAVCALEGASLVSSVVVRDMFYKKYKPYELPESNGH